MSMKIDWDEIGKDSNKKGGTGDKKQVEFLRLTTGSTYKIRPLGGPVVFYKYFLEHEGQWRWAICGDLDTCPVRQKHNVEPRERYAINVLDRADGKIKVMEGPVMVFKIFRAQFNATQNSPGGPEGGDFAITVTGVKKQTRYETVFLGRTPFTQKEREYLKAEGLFNLEQIYAATPADEIEDVLFGGGKAKSQTAKVFADVADDAGDTKETVAVLSVDDQPDDADVVPW